MASDNQNFSGWGGKTKFFSGGSPYDFFNNNTKSVSEPNPKLTVGPVTITKSPKVSPSRTKSAGPVYKTGDTQTQTVSNRRSVNTPLGVDLPFTAGTVDYSFPAGGGTYVDGFNGAIYHIIVDSNGKYLLGGSFATYYYNGGGYYSPYLIRLNPDGTVDDSFNTTIHHDCYGGSFNGTVYTLEIQPDGKILVGGSFTSYDRDGNCNTSNRIIRLNYDGSRDLTFNTGDGFDSEVYDIHIQPDGKILVGGDFTQYNGVDAYRIIRLNSNGSIDSSFLIGNGDVAFDNYVNVIELQLDGKILVGGYFNTYGFNSQNYIARLNTDGTLDTTFQIGVGFNDEVYTIALQSDGKIIVGGYFDYFDNNDLFSGQIVRLDSNGTLDTLFGRGLSNQVHSIAIQSDGKILVGGYFNTYYFENSAMAVDQIVRFHSDCSFDYSFSSQDILNDGVEYISILEDDNILIGGFFNNNGEDPSVYPLNYFGRLHNSISTYPYTYVVEDCNQPLYSSKLSYTVGSMTELSTDLTYSFKKLSNPSVTVCGYVNLNIPPSNIIDYEMVSEYVNCDESLSNNANIVFVSDMLDLGEGYNLLVDSKYVVGDILYVDLVFDIFATIGFIKTAVQINGILPYQSGYYFPSAIIPYQPYKTVTEAVEENGIHYAVATTCDNNQITHFPLIHKEYYETTSILLPGFGSTPCKEVINVVTFAPYELISYGTEELFSVVEFTDCDECLTKMGKTGLLDTTLYDGGFDGSLVYTTVEQPDGKILVGGNFVDYDGTEVNNFMRLNSDGTLDETFFVGGFNSGGYVRAIALQSDGKILVGGNFTNYDGYNVGRIIRLNSDGSVDENFTFNTEFNGVVRAIALQTDGKILVGGGFNYYYDYYCNSIVRLNTDGTPDTTFNTGDGFNGQVYTINVESTKVPPSSNSGNDATTYFEDIQVGGWFTEYNSQTSRGIARLDRDGNLMDDFGFGFNNEEGGDPRVNQIFKQQDGKLVIVGGADNGHLIDYQGIFIPRNIVRLEKNNSGQYQIDPTFDVPNYYLNGGGFYNGYPLSVVQQPNGKLIVGGNFYTYEDNEGQHLDLYNIIRLNTNGSYDSTFSMGEGFDGQVNKVLSLSDGKLLTGGWYQLPTDHLTRLYIGEEYELRSFDTCDGSSSNIFLPTNTEISTVLDLIYDGDYDDSNFFIELPLDFDINFLGTNYTSVYIGSNSYLTFGEGSNKYDFSIPSEITTDGPALPGVYISTRRFINGFETNCIDSAMWKLYSGTTDGGNTTIIRFEGNDDYTANQGDTNLVYNFKFYKDQSDYFDLIIEQNVYFCGDDPTGGTSDGGNLFISSFDSSTGNSYRIDSYGNVTPLTYSPFINSEVIKANINDRVVVCGTVGDAITTPQLNPNSGIGGSMYFDGNTSYVTINPYIPMDLNFGPWTVEWFQKYTSTDTCCRRVFDIGQNPNEEFGVSIENGNTILLWMASGATTINLNTPVYDTWSYFAISSENLGGTSQVIRVYQDGVIIWSGFTNVDINNFQGDPSVNLPLIIGGGDSGTNSLFEGYITNFRWTKGLCYYQGSTMVVPTIPLNALDSQLLFLTTDETGLMINAASESNPYRIPANEISQNNVIWSSESPFIDYDFSLYTATNFTSYNSCDDCLNTNIYQVSLYVRNFLSIKNNEILPNFVSYNTMTLSDIQKVQSFGPIFTTRGPESYEILNYNL